MTIITINEALKNIDDQAERRKLADIAFMLEPPDPVGKQLWTLILACEACRKSWDEWDHEFYRGKHDNEYEYDRDKLNDAYAALGMFIVEHTEVLDR